MYSIGRECGFWEGSADVLGEVDFSKRRRVWDGLRVWQWMTLTSDPQAFTSQVLEVQACATIPCYLGNLKTSAVLTLKSIVSLKRTSQYRGVVPCIACLACARPWIHP